MNIMYNNKVAINAAMAQEVERILGKDEVTSSTLVSSSKKKDTMKIVSFFLCLYPPDATSFRTEKNSITP